MRIFFKILDRMPFDIAPIKNDIMYASRLIARKVKKVNETNDDVDLPSNEMAGLICGWGLSLESTELCSPLISKRAITVVRLGR